MPLIFHFQILFYILIFFIQRTFFTISPETRLCKLTLYHGSIAIFLCCISSYCVMYNSSFALQNIHPYKSFASPTIRSTHRSSSSKPFLFHIRVDKRFLCNRSSAAAKFTANRYYFFMIIIPLLSPTLSSVLSFYYLPAP